MIRAATCAFVAFVAACAPRTRSAEPAHIVRVLVYNIHAGKDASGQDNLERVAEIVRAGSADVVLLQEVDRNTQRSGGVDQPALLARLTGYHAAFGKTLDYQGGEYGIAILSRWPVTSDTLIHLVVDPPQERAGGLHEPRGAQRVVIEAPVGRLVAINTHLDPAREAHWRRQEMRAVGELTKTSVALDSALVLVGGDFNSTPESPEQGELRATGLRDAWTVCGVGDGKTYPANAPVKRIDYVFLTGRNSCVDARVLTDQASDHRALLVLVRAVR